jgi:3-phosphoshikimate 1-carboxyvinyltransferase
MDRSMSRQILRPARRVLGTLRVPGDKSIGHRALIVSAIGQGTCHLRGLGPSLDLAATLDSIGRLGVRMVDSKSLVEGHEVSTRELVWEVLVEGRGWAGFRKPDEHLDCRNSGTTARLLLGVLAGRPFTATLDGDASLRRRPMLRVVEPLREMGAVIEGPQGGDRLPLRVRGGRLRGICHRMPVASAQVKSCLLLAGLQAAGETEIEVPAPSRDHTERLLRYLGAPLRQERNRLIVQSTDLHNASELSVPGDLSSAAYALAAAAILPGSEVRVDDVGLNPTRTGFLDVLRRFGATVQILGEREECGEPRGTVLVRAGDRRPVQVAGVEVPRAIDELPLVAVLGTVAEGETVIADAAELRVKESDRIATLAAALVAMGASVEVRPDGLVVRGPARLRGATVNAAGDHRIAMALAVAALAASGETVIEGWESVHVSYPRFLEDLERLVER